VELQQLACKISDQPRRVIRLMNHLHDVTDGALQELDEIP
jgi:hypothetical protein